MTTTVHVKAKLTPWDDPAFLHAFDEARADTERSGCCPEGPEAAARVEHLLRAGGFPRARIEVERSVEESLQHVSHWTVRRDG